jgi:methyl-accepting chemotaxis protein/methyl-accepting chemotaxis protein-1 (serine sensor receptor)
LNHSARETAPSQQAIGALLASVKEMKASAHTAQMTIVIGYMEKGSKLEGSCTACHDAGMLEKQRLAFAEGAKAARTHLSKLRGLSSSDRRLIADLETSITKWEGMEAGYTRKASAGDFDSAHAVLMDEIDPLVKKAGATAVALSKAGEKELAESAVKGDGLVRTTRWLMAALCLLSMMAGALGMRTVFGATANLRDCGWHLTSVVRRLTESAALMASSSESLAAGVEQEGACLRETALKGEEVRKQAASNASGAREAETGVEMAARSTVEAAAVLAEMGEAMESIDANTKKVAGILKVMDEIAFQTNLLALNASVEAARAGQAGMGFAVVAEEVRTLAKRSADAARETAGLVETARAKSAEGRRLSERAREAVQAIASQSESIQGVVRRVNASSQDQARSLESVKSAIDELERLAAQNEEIARASAASAEQVALGGSELSEVASRVERMAGV